MRKLSLSLTTLVILSGCAYVNDTSVQDITIRTPGAEDAKCMMFIDKVRYRVHPPQTISIFRTEHDLIVDCMAPGNRRKKVEIPATINDSAQGNIATAGIGYGWDYASGALYKYPDVVEVSFIGMPIGPAFIPAQNNPDIRQPEEYMLEEFKPSRPRMNEDRYREMTILEKRGGAMEMELNPAENFVEPQMQGPGKGDLKPVPPPSVSSNYDEGLYSAGSEGPTPLIPGQ